MSRLTRDGTAKPVSRNQILRRKRSQGNVIFTYSADHEQDWQPYKIDYAMTIHTCNVRYRKYQRQYSIPMDSFLKVTLLIVDPPTL